MFSTATAGAAAGGGRVANFVLLSPGAGVVQVGPTMEEVRFTRDEMANMAWGVEHVTENALAAPWPAQEREAAVQSSRPEPAQLPSTDPLRYVLQSTVPEYWIPLVPVALNATRGEVAFKPATMLSADGGLTSPAGRILTMRPIREEAIPRIGVRLQRAASRTRWIDGTTHLWISRRRLVAGTEGNSGLRFDQTIPSGSPE